MDVDAVRERAGPREFGSHEDIPRLYREAMASHERSVSGQTMGAAD
jgi:hypothetical protein